MTHAKRIVLFACSAALLAGMATSAFARPPWPPVPWGHERVFFDNTFQIVGGIVACPTGSSSWGLYTTTYQDTPVNCP